MDKMDGIRAEIDFIEQYTEVLNRLTKAMKDISRTERWTDRAIEFDRWLDVLGYYLYLLYISNQRIHEIRLFEREENNVGPDTQTADAS